MARLTLTDSDAQVRRWLVQEATRLDCTVKIDSMGNIFIKRAGEANNGKPMIAMGSHLDTQPRGGRYDGILGVIAGLEVLRTMAENDVRTTHDIGLVNWTKSVY
jgi:acetylornithine deacetylase/succinyl-diaminopimelate desuccinylase-like protein